jgi:hypothetical protein
MTSDSRSGERLALDLSDPFGRQASIRPASRSDSRRPLPSRTAAPGRGAPGRTAGSPSSVRSPGGRSAPRPRGSPAGTRRPRSARRARCPVVAAEGEDDFLRLADVVEVAARQVPQFSCIEPRPRLRIDLLVEALAVASRPLRVARCLGYPVCMARFVYIDETGTSRKQPLLTITAAIVDEEMVQPLAGALRQVAKKHLGWLPADFEFHGRELWHGDRYWTGKAPPELIAAYEAAVALLDQHEISIAYATINKPALHDRYQGAADRNAYRLALQFLLEKVVGLGEGRKILVADEAKEQELHAVKMVADMQEWGGGEVPGKQLKTIIDSLHFVSSHASPGVQVADLVAFVLQRRRANESHPDAQAGLGRLSSVINEHTATWREPWPKA